MLCRVIVGLKEGVRDVLGEKIARKIKSELGMDVRDVRIVNVFTLEGATQGAGGPGPGAGRAARSGPARGLARRPWRGTSTGSSRSGSGPA